MKRFEPRLLHSLSPITVECLKDTEDAIRLVGGLSFGPYLSSASDCCLTVFYLFSGGVAGGPPPRRRACPTTPPSDGASFDSSETVKTFPFSWDCSSFSIPWPVSGSGSLRRNFPASRRLWMIGLVALTLFRTSAWCGCEHVICRFFLLEFSCRSSVPVLYTYEMYQCFMAECSGRLHLWFEV